MLSSQGQLAPLPHLAPRVLQGVWGDGGGSASTGVKKQTRFQVESEFSLLHHQVCELSLKQGWVLSKPQGLDELAPYTAAAASYQVVGVYDADDVAESVSPPRAVVVPRQVLGLLNVVAEVGFQSKT